MIQTIMHCEECGAALREWDFLKRRARLLENRPYCVSCRPFGRSQGTVEETILPGPLSNGAWTLPRNRQLV